MEELLKASREKKNIRLYLSNMGLSEIPDLHEFSWIEELNLNNNMIVSIIKDKLPPNLKQLEICNNKLEEISANDLRDSVNRLIVTNNKIKEFKGNAFYNLTDLHIGLNELTDFTFPPKIVNLDVKKNYLIALPKFPEYLKFSYL